MLTKPIKWIFSVLEDQEGGFSSKRATLAVLIILLYRIVENVLRTGKEFADKDLLWFIFALIALCLGFITSEFFKSIMTKITTKNDVEVNEKGHPQKPTQP